MMLPSLQFVAMRTKAIICCVSSSILLLAAASKCLKKRKRRKRTVWVKDWLLQRESKGAFNQIFEELRVGDPASFQNYVRMNAQGKSDLLNLYKTDDNFSKVFISFFYS